MRKSLFFCSLMCMLSAGFSSGVYAQELWTIEQKVDEMLPVMKVYNNLGWDWRESLPDPNHIQTASMAGQPGDLESLLNIYASISMNGVYSVQELTDLGYALVNGFDGNLPEGLEADAEGYCSFMLATPQICVYEKEEVESFEDHSLDVTYRLENEEGPFAMYKVHLIPNEHVNEAAAHPFFYTVDEVSFTPIA